MTSQDAPDPQSPRTPDGPLMELWNLLATVGTDGFTAGSGRREVRMSVQQMLTLARHFTDAELEVLAVFLRDMQVYRDGDLDRIYVEGFSRDYLIREGVAAYRARKGLAGLVDKGILSSEWAPGQQSAVSPAWKCLVGTRFALRTAHGPARRHGVAPSGPDAPSNPDLTGERCGHSPAGVSTGRVSTTRAQGVDNSIGRVSTERHPAWDQPAPGPANAQVRTYGRIATERVSASTRTEVLSELSVSTSPGSSPRTSEVALFVRHPDMLDRLTRDEQALVAAVRSFLSAPGLAGQARSVLAFLVVAPSDDPVRDVVALAVEFLSCRGEQARLKAIELREHFRATRTNVPAVSEDDLLVGTALTLLAAVDAQDAIKSFPAWFAACLKVNRQWRQSPSLLALFSQLRQVAASPSDDPDGFGVADISNERYVAHLRRARDYVVDRGLLPQYDGDFYDLVLSRPLSVHRKILDRFERAVRASAAAPAEPGAGSAGAGAW